MDLSIFSRFTFLSASLKRDYMGTIAFIQHKNMEAPLRISTKPVRQKVLHPLYRFIDSLLIVRFIDIDYKPSR